MGLCLLVGVGGMVWRRPCVGGLGGEPRGLALIVFFLQRLLETLGHVIPWFLEGC